MATYRYFTNLPAGLQRLLKHFARSATSARAVGLRQKFNPEGVEYPTPQFQSNQPGKPLRRHRMSVELEGRSLTFHSAAAACRHFRLARGPVARLKRMGEAGANLVLSKLMSWRVPACAATPGMAYDILADVEGQFYRIQVKTTTKMICGRFTFMLHRGFHGSGKGMFDYAASDYDIAALVCWPLGRVYFCTGPVQRVVITTEWLQSDGFERQSWELAVALLKQRRAS